MWYGLTRDEAQSRCVAMGLQSSFSMTMDPKAAKMAVHHEGDDVTSPRVIRASEEKGVMMILLGLFAEGADPGRRI